MNTTLRRSGWMLVGLLPVLAAAQAGKLAIPDFGDLAKKATEAVDITLDSDMLKSASSMMGGGASPDVSGVVSGLKSITVRSFKFDKPNMYSPQEVAGVLAQAGAPGWKKVISVHKQDELVEIHMRENSTDGGLLIVTEQPLALTVINIAGKINMDQLRQLQGHMGVPSMPGVIGSGAPPAPPATPSPGAPVAPPASAAPAPPAAPAAPGAPL
jgi:hypothetical protein